MNETNKSVIRGIKSASWSKETIECIEKILDSKEVHTANIDQEEINITFKDSEKLRLIK
jgi:hypothetical protein